jgi:tetratricopeptide (TPR) repeat protein
MTSAKTAQDLDKAISEYRWAIMRSPWASSLYFTISYAYSGRGRFLEAEKNMQLFVQGNPKAENVDKALASLYQAQYQQEQDMRALAAMCKF